MVSRVSMLRVLSDRVTFLGAGLLTDGAIFPPTVHKRTPPAGRLAGYLVMVTRVPMLDMVSDSIA